jgi:hypothetical protein
VNGTKQEFNPAELAEATGEAEHIAAQVERARLLALEVDFNGYAIDQMINAIAHECALAAARRLVAALEEDSSHLDRLRDMTRQLDQMRSLIVPVPY